MSHSKSLKTITLQFAPKLDLTGLPSKAVISTWIEDSMLFLAATGRVCVRFTCPEESRLLNATYRGADKATNVLSFPYGWICPENGETILGDLVLCLDVLRQEALEQHKSLKQHLAHLLIHGLLHLLGFDHQTDDEASVMEQKEIEILQQFGFPNPYGV